MKSTRKAEKYEKKKNVKKIKKRKKPVDKTGFFSYNRFCVTEKVNAKLKSVLGFRRMEKYSSG